MGAILVQNTAWTNVEKALAALRAARAACPTTRSAALGRAELAPLIRPSGCFNVKARRLRAFLDFLGREYGGRVEAMAARGPAASCARSCWPCRASAARPPTPSCSTPPGLPLFVVDAYTRRVFAPAGR